MKFKGSIMKICELLELVVALLVLIGILFSICSLVKDFEIFHAILNHTESLQTYLDQIFVIVIGIEFLQMLCSPNSDNIMEVLIFLVARHMIVSETAPFEDFISVISIILLCVLRRYLHDTREKPKAGNGAAAGAPEAETGESYGSK
ncbi:MAG: hypothetical protein NC341_09045 [Blautia sp.]|nr:hypothetical protein [Blautia sp.]MCM1201864.1 hypothetical protein [Bacteroides fragilis]